MIIQDFQNIALVASQLFGSDKKKEPEAEAPQTAEALQSSFAQVFGRG